MAKVSSWNAPASLDVLLVDHQVVSVSLDTDQLVYTPRSVWCGRSPDFFDNNLDEPRAQLGYHVYLS